MKSKFFRLNSVSVLGAALVSIFFTACDSSEKKTVKEEEQVVGTEIDISMTKEKNDNQKVNANIKTGAGKGSLLGAALSLAGETLNSVLDDETMKDINTTAKQIGKTKTKLKTNLNLDFDDKRDLDKMDKEFLSSLKSCNELTITSTATDDITKKSKKEVRPVNGKCEFKETGIKTVTCLFEKQDLEKITSFYAKKLQGYNMETYNLDLDFKLPTINFGKEGKEGLNINFDMNMPKVKVDEVKEDITTLIQKSCK